MSLLLLKISKDNTLVLSFIGFARCLRCVFHPIDSLNSSLQEPAARSPKGGATAGPSVPHRCPSSPSSCCPPRRSPSLWAACWSAMSARRAAGRPLRNRPPSSGAGGAAASQTCSCRPAAAGTQSSWRRRLALTPAPPARRAPSGPAADTPGARLAGAEGGAATRVSVAATRDECRPTNWTVRSPAGAKRGWFRISLAW